MAWIIQVLLPLVAVVLAEAQLIMPFLHNIPGFHNPSRPASGGPMNSQIAQHNAGYNGGYNSWFQHFSNPDAHQFSSESHESDNFSGDYDPFFNRDPYFHQGNWDHMPIPGLDTVFNIPRPGHNSHGHHVHIENIPQEKPKQVHNEGLNDQKPKEKQKEIPPIDPKPSELDKDPEINVGNISDEKNKVNKAEIPDVKNQLNEKNIPDVKNNLNEPKISDDENNEELLPPKTNKVTKEDDKGEEDDKVDLDKKKDFLLVGQGNNGNNVYLLHENKPNPSTVVTPNVNQPANNVIYVPYNPGQTNNPVYQVINGQPASQNPANVQIAQDKSEVSNGYNNVNAQPTTNFNTGTQNPGYVTIYSNGQLIQIPGVVVNSAPNNAPIQNGNQPQGTNYIIANAVPNNVQSVPAYQNPGTNVIYAAIPNQPSNGPIYIQVPNCMNTMTAGCGSGTVVQNSGVNTGISSNGLPSNVIYYQANPNSAAQPVSNGYVQPNMVGNQVQGAITIAIPNQSGQNGQYQQVVQVPVNSGYSQPIVSNLGQGQNQPNPGATVQVPIDSNNGYNQPIISNQQGQNMPNQGEKQQVFYQVPTTNNQNIQYQPAGQNLATTNGYYQPIVSNQAQGQDAPTQGTTVDNQNTQPGIVIPIPSGYGNPLITNPIVNARADTPSDQNAPQSAVLLNIDSNISNQEGTNANVNTPSNTEVINQSSDVAEPLAKSSIVLDSNNLLTLGAQPAIMISDFKDKSEDDKKDKKKSKDKVKKEKKDKGKKKDKKPKADDQTIVSEPFTNEKVNLLIR